MPVFFARFPSGFPPPSPCTFSDARFLLRGHVSQLPPNSPYPKHICVPSPFATAVDASRDAYVTHPSDAKDDALSSSA